MSLLVSSLWTSLFDSTRKKFEALNTYINDKLSSHCNKKGSNQVMAETHGVSAPAQMFRTGWGKRGQDTIWEYLSDSFVLSKQAVSHPH